MQKAEINYTGISTRPSEYNCKDGELALLQNLINEDGALKPLGLPPVSFSQSQELIYNHKNSSYSNYIFRSDKSLFYSKKGESTKYDIASFNSNIKSVSSIGNMLLILTDEGLYYSIYSDGIYTLLGNKLPELPDFEIQEVSNTESTSISKTITDTNIKLGERTDEAADSNDTYLINEFYSLLNTKLNEAYETNYFIFPFFIRYAYRLFDGSLACHSAPILVLSNNRNVILKSPEKFSINQFITISMNKIQIDGVGMKKIKILGKSSFNIDAWKDIIQSVDVFVSQPLYPINMDATRLQKVESVNTYDTSGNIVTGFTKYTFKGSPTNEDYLNKVKENSLFYKAASYNISEITQYGSSFTKTIPGDNMKTIVNQEVMTDDYKSRNINYANGMYVYNSRLNLFGLRSGLFKGFPISKFDIRYNSVDTPYACKISDAGTTSIAVYIKNTSGQISVVRSTCAGTYKIPKYFFYPDSLAFKMVITTGGYSQEFILESHKGLNGSQYINPDLIDVVLSGTVYETQEANTIVSYPNEIKLSEVNNPITFKAANYYAVGTGEVLCVSSATKALSQGQFGQFPLYAFTTEGIWALEISSNGTYSVKHPATRDVCNNVDSIVQLDGAIAFTTKQGLMLLIGSDSKCISENLNDTPFQTLQFLDQFTSVLQIPIKTYLEECRIAYDYTNSRIIVFNPDQSFSYVYSMKSQKWSILNQTFSKVLNVYPDCFLQKVNGSNFDVIDISSDYTPENIQGVIVTRSIKFDSPGILKTIHQVVHNGIFRKGKVKSILYGSRDYINYFPITSSADNFIRSVLGTSYKCFRFVISVDISDGESISSTSIVYDTKYNNKLR